MVNMNTMQYVMFMLWTGGQEVWALFWTVPPHLCKSFVSLNFCIVWLYCLLFEPWFRTLTNSLLPWGYLLRCGEKLKQLQ